MLTIVDSLLVNLKYILIFHIRQVVMSTDIECDSDDEKGCYAKQDVNSSNTSTTFKKPSEDDTIKYQRIFQEKKKKLKARKRKEKIKKMMKSSIFKK